MRHEPLFRQLAKRYPAVTVVASRQTGKTTLARMVFPDKPYASLQDQDARRFV